MPRGSNSKIVYEYGKDFIAPGITGGGAAPKPFSYDSGSRILVVDGFSYEVLEANSSNLRIRSRFSPEQWSRDSHIVITFQRNTKGLGNK